MNHEAHPLSSADISIFSSEIRKSRFIKKYRYILRFDTYRISNSFNFSWVFKDCFNKNGYSFDDVSKNGYPRPF